MKHASNFTRIKLSNCSSLMARDPVRPGFMGVHIHSGDAMPADCKNCPFKLAEEGEAYLTEERYDGIMHAVCLGQPFFCHKTVYNNRTKFDLNEEGDREAPTFERHYRMCSGAKRWAEMVKEGRDPVDEFVRNDK